MRTELQREASRRNGTKSKGPITDKGKAISSRNSRIHGRYSSDFLIQFAAYIASPMPILPHQNTFFSNEPD